MSEQVYVVTAGSYSDYGIMAVFSTERAALDYCALGGKYSDRRVEVYPIDEEVAAGESSTEGRVYKYSAMLWDRSTRRFGPPTIDNVEEEMPTASIRTPAPGCETELSTSVSGFGDTVHRLEVYGTDYERVRKVYGEKLAELKARMEGIA